MDENKIIRVVLEARDGLSGVLSKARKNVDAELEEMNKSFLKSRKGMQLVENEYESMTQSIADDSKDIDKATVSIRQMTKALRDAQKEAKAAKAGVRGVVQDIKGEVSGRRTIRGPGGRVLPGRGQEAGDIVLVNKATKETVAVNRSLNDVLSHGFRIAKATQKALDQELGATREIRQQRLKEAEERNRINKIRLSAQQDEIRAEEASVVELRTRESGLLEKRLALQKQANAAAKKFEDSRNDDDLENLAKVENELKFLENHISQIKRDVSTERTRLFQQQRQDLSKTFNEEKANIKSLTRADKERIIARVKEERKALLSSGTRRDQIGKRVGFAVGDFFGGISRGKSDIRDLDKDLEKLSSTFGRVGFAIGGAFKDLNSLVNLRWLFLTSAITLFVNILTQLVVVLVSVASSAILAGAALGGALIAGVTQALPVVGLLAGAFHSLQNVLKAVQLEDKANIKSDADAKEAADKRTQAVQRLADAHYAVKQALQGVQDANYNLAQSHQRVSEAEKDRIQAVRDLAEARKKAAQDIVDANLQEKDSALALQEAELGVLQAKEKLRQEEEKAKKGQTDIADAQAAVKEAQDRLKLAQTQGDAAEVVKANQQLSLANQNLDSIQDNINQSKNDVKDAQLGVQRAEINRQQAANKKKKDETDASRLRKQGVEQAQSVLDAEKQLASATKAIADAQHDVAQSQRQISDSVHSLAVARREEADAKRALADKTNLQSTAQKNLNEAISNFSPAEKRLYKALLRVKNAYKKAFSGTKNKDGILAPIIDGFSAIADAITKLLTDPKILKALGGLADSIGEGIQRFARLLTSKDFKKDLLFFIDQATQNLPKVVDIFISILGLVRKIGKEAAPIFGDLLGGLDTLLGKADKAAGQKVGGINSGGRPEEGTRGPTGAKQQTRLGRFLEGAEKHLKAWLNLGKAIGRVIFLLINVSAPTGKSLIESATDALNRLGDYIEKNPEKVQKFFDSIADSFKTLADALLGLAVLFGKVAQDPQIQAFAIFLVETIVPGLFLMIKAVGYVVGALTALTKVPILGGFLKFAIQIAIAEKALNKLFPVSQGITNVIRKGLTKSFQGLFAIIKDPQRSLASFKRGLNEIGLAAEVTKNKIKDIGTSWKDAGSSAKKSIGEFNELRKARRITEEFALTFPKIVNAIRLVRLAFVSLLFTPPYILLAIAAIVTAIILLDKKFHFLAPTIKFIKKIMIEVFDWAKSHWHLLVAILTGPIGVAVLLIIKHWEKVKKLFFGFKDLLTKYYYRPVYNAIIKPFVEAATFIVGIFKALPGLIIKAVKPLGGLLGKALDKIPGFRWAQDHGIIPKFGKSVGQVKGALKVIGGGLKVVGGGIGGAADSADTALGGSHPKKQKPSISTKKRTASNVLNNDVRDQKTIRRLRKSGLTDDDILDWLINHGAISKAGFRKRFGFPLSSVQGFGAGSSGVKGVGKTDTVPAMLTPGEWVLNSEQIKKLARLLGTTVNQAKAQIFGTNTGNKLPSNLRPSSANTVIGKSFTLIPKEDDDGNTVWFIQMADGTFGQVTRKDADKITKTNGLYIPGYVKRNSHGFQQSVYKAGFRPFAAGGVVPMFANGGITHNGIRGFADGGIVQSPGYSGSTNAKTINQNFNVKTEGATDWSYVMRLSSITAQSAF